MITNSEKLGVQFHINFDTIDFVMEIKHVVSDVADIQPALLFLI